MENEIGETSCLNFVTNDDDPLVPVLQIENRNHPAFSILYYLRKKGGLRPP